MERAPAVRDVVGRTEAGAGQQLPVDMIRQV